MPEHHDHSEEDEEAFDQFLDSLEAGTAPSVDEFLVAWPAASPELRARLVALRQRLGTGTKRPEEIGGLTVRGVLGAGGMGEVLRAHDPALDREVAVKILVPALARNPARVERLKREARILAALDHPNVATVHALGEANAATGGSLHIVMELVDGEDLACRLQRAPLDWETALDVLEQIAAALAAAHDRGIIHRDLKPSNVMVRPDGRIKVLDFGLSSRLSRDGSDLPAVDSSDGTPAYMSPEQVAGSPQDERTDIWAFGCIAHEALTGERPGRDRPLQLAQTIPGAVRKLVTRCLSLDANGRPVDGQALCAEILHLREGLGRNDTAPAAPPEFRTRFVDSEGRIQEVRELLQRHDLITLVGAAGSGKTRLAAEAARCVEEACWVDLATVTAEGVVEALTRGVGIRGDVSLKAVAAALRERHALLVVDNCESVAPEASRCIAELLAAAPDLSILATSRAPLGLDGEYLLASRPLLGAGSSIDAVDLFLDRARSAGCTELGRAGVDKDPKLLEQIETLCQRFDGLPLAIEMAASRAASLGLEVLVERTETSLGLLRQETPSKGERHDSLSGAIRSSVDALSPQQRQVFLCLSVFRGGWTLRALEDVLEHAQLEGVTRDDALDALGSLTRASLVAREPGRSRWRLLQTIQTYAAGELARLTGPGSSPAARAKEAHARVFLRLGDEAFAAAFGAARVAAFHALENDVPNFVAAVESCAVDPARAERAAVLVAQLFEFWISRGLLNMGARALEQALAAAPDLSLEGRVHCILSLGTIAHRRGNAAKAEAHLEAAVELAAGDIPLPLRAKAIRNLAYFRLTSGDFEQARPGLEEALAIELPLGDNLRMGNLRNDLGILAIYEGRLDDAAECYAQGLELRRAAGNTWGVASSLGNLGEVYHRLGQLDRARQFLGESLAAFLELDDLRSVAESLEMSASLEITAKHHEFAARLAGSAAGLRERMGFPKPAAELQSFMKDLDSARNSLGAERWRALEEEGRMATLDQSAAWALRP